MSTAHGFWMRRTLDGVAAVSEVMFPVNDLGAPDWQDTEMVRRSAEYFEELPPPTRRLLMLLFVAVELGAPLLLVGFGRLSRISLPRRSRVLLGWHSSRFFLFRMLAEALKAQLCMTYMSHGAVQRYMGVWKSCGREADPYPLPVVEEPFSASTADGLREGVVLP